MSLWRLEWLRLVRTRRLLAILGAYCFFGLTGPLTARYLSQLLDAIGTEGVRVEFPEPTPADGIAQFVSSASQICLLIVVFVAAAALAFDGRREMAVFLRTRVRGVHAVILPAYIASTGAAVAGLLAGSLAAWYETAVLLGAPPTAAMLAGIGYGAVFLAFAVGLVAFVAELVGGVLAAAGTTLVTLLAMSLVGGATNHGRWLPTGLLGALADLARGASATAYLPALGITVAATAATLAGAVSLAGRRDL
jgi:ABC-2 type transport system permease protein